MANRDAAMGFLPSRHAFGGVIRLGSTYNIVSGLASTICRGDAVIPVNTSKRINVAAATDRLQGVFDGCVYFDSQGDVQIRPRWATGTVAKTGTLVEANVYDDPNILFEIQGDEDIVEADIGALADIAVTAGDAASGQSRMELDSSNIGTGDTLKIIELGRGSDNAYGDFAKVLVKISKHYLAGATTAI